MDLRRIKKWVNNLSEDELDKPLKICHIDDQGSLATVLGVIQDDVLDWDIGWHKEVKVLCRFPREKMYPRHIIRVDEGERYIKGGRFIKSRREKVWEVFVDGIRVNYFDNYGDASDLCERLQEKLNHD